MKRASIFAALAAAVSVFIFFMFNKGIAMDKNYGFRLKEPMRISTTGERPYYLIPASTVLYHQKGFDEGHQLYTIEVLVKGNLEADRLQKNESSEPIWLYPVEADDVAKLMQDYPLTKDDLIRILKARKMTREELAQIVREWTE